MTAPHLTVWRPVQLEAAGVVRLRTVGEVAEDQLAAVAAAEAEVLRLSFHRPLPAAALQRLRLVLLPVLHHLEGEGKSADVEGAGGDDSG